MIDAVMYKCNAFLVSGIHENHENYVPQIWLYTMICCISGWVASISDQVEYQ